MSQDVTTSAIFGQEETWLAATDMSTHRIVTELVTAPVQYVALVDIIAGHAVSVEGVAFTTETRETACIITTILGAATVVGSAFVYVVAGNPVGIERIAIATNARKGCAVQ